LQITLQPVWEGLAKHCWTDAEIAQLERELGGVDFVSDYQVSMARRKCFQVATIDLLRHRVGPFGHLELFRRNTIPLRRRSGRLIPSGWFYQNELRSSQFILEQFLPIADMRQQTMSPTLAKRAGASLGPDPTHPLHDAFQAVASSIREKPH